MSLKPLCPDPGGHLVFMAVPARAWRKVCEILAQAKADVWRAGTDPDPEEVVGMVYLRAVRWIGPPADPPGPTD